VERQPRFQLIGHELREERSETILAFKTISNMLHTNLCRGDRSDMAQKAGKVFGYFFNEFAIVSQV
jgi:hypothetical protein